MLGGVDRIQVVSLERGRAAGAWRRLLGAELVREDRVPALAASRSVLRLGSSEVEILQMEGIGTVAHHLARFGPGLFAVGFSVADAEAARAHLESRGIHHVALERQIFLHHDWLDLPGLHVVLSPAAEPEPKGLLTHLYEVTHLCHDQAAAAARLAHAFDLDPSRFVPIRSEPYGYQGTLTLLRPDRLDRVETVTPFDRSKTMGRYFARRGPCLYMAYAESDATDAVRERLRDEAPRDWTGPHGTGTPDNLFIHPNALEGVMLGVSRTSFAWSWSGRPDLVQPARGAAA